MFPFNMTVDFDPSRSPDRILTATCRWPDTYCSSTGPHLCTAARKSRGTCKSSARGRCPDARGGLNAQHLGLCMPYSVAADGVQRRVIQNDEVSGSHNIFVPNALNALVYASGLAATHNVTHLLSPGDHIVSFDDVYGGTNRLFRALMVPRGFEITFVDATDLKKVEAVLRPTTKLVWIETPSNPTMKVVDIKGVCELVKRKCSAIVAVDNTFMSAYFQKPLDLGADISVHSLTKYMNGHSDVVMGAVCTSDAEIHERLRYFQNAAGAVPSPFDCFLVNRGLKTLHVRMERHMENGLKVAKFLSSHPLVEKVLHPGLPSHPQHEIAKRQCSGFSGMVSFYIKGGLAESTSFLKNLQVIILAESLGSIESLAELPAVMTHASVPENQRKELGISDNLVRLSIGIEDSDDLIKDIDQALRKAVQK
ncbi:cystathionine gamma-lyase [Ixodes scapularis]